MNHTESGAPLDPAAILRRLGGARVIAPQFYLSKFTVWGWYRRGIPPERFPGIIAIAAAQGVPLTFEELFAASNRHNGS